MRVKALRKGYYDHLLRPVGEVFVIPDDEKPGSWMQVVPKGTQLTREDPNPLTGEIPSEKKTRGPAAPASVI